MAKWPSKQTDYIVAMTKQYFQPKRTVTTKPHTTIVGETSGKTEAYQGGHEVWSPCMEFFGVFQHTTSNSKNLHK